MTLEELNNLAKELALEYWDDELSIPIRINKKYKKIAGAMKSEEISPNNFIPIDISISSRLINFGEYEWIVSTLKHELTHYIMCKRGQEFDDGLPAFEAELLRIGACSSGYEDGEESIKYQQAVIEGKVLEFKKQNTKDRFKAFKFIKIKDNIFDVQYQENIIGQVEKINKDFWVYRYEGFSNENNDIGCNSRIVCAEVIKCMLELEIV